MIKSNLNRCSVCFSCLQLRVGDLVKVVETVDFNWLKGLSQEAVIGCFPSNHVSLVNIDNIPLCAALFDFIPSNINSHNPSSSSSPSSNPKLKLLHFKKVRGLVIAEQTNCWLFCSYGDSLIRAMLSNLSDGSIQIGQKEG